VFVNDDLKQEESMCYNTMKQLVSYTSFY